MDELRAIAERHAGSGALAFVDRPDLGLRIVVARRGGPRSVDHVFDRQVGVIVAGEKRVILGDRKLTARAGHYFIAPVPLPVAFELPRASTSEPFVAVTVQLEPTRVAALVADAPEIAAGEGALEISDAPPDVLDAMLRLVRLLDRPRDIPVLGPAAERELLYRLLCSDQGGRLRELARADSRVSQIGRALHWIQQHYREPLRVEKLARLAAMSPTSFHRHFRAVAAMSPLQFQKHMRLQAARAQLLAGAGDVAQVGRAVGWASPAQFSREYKRAYGTPPSSVRPRAE